MNEILITLYWLSLVLMFFLNIICLALWKCSPRQPPIGATSWLATSDTRVNRCCAENVRRWTGYAWPTLGGELNLWHLKASWWEVLEPPSPHYHRLSGHSGSLCQGALQDSAEGDSYTKGSNLGQKAENRATVQWKIAR